MDFKIIFPRANVEKGLGFSVCPYKIYVDMSIILLGCVGRFQSNCLLLNEASI